MNRETLRDLRKMPIRDFEKTVNQVFDEQIARTRQHSYNLAWTSMLLAMTDRYPELMTAEVIHSIAVDTLEYTNGIEPASELAAKLLERTGFDIYENTKQSKLKYIEKN